MDFKKISAPSLKELFVQQLENMILSGKLETGEKLPPERELAEMMDVSRAVVNAGINEMAAKGFLEVRPRVGVFVGDYRRNGTIETLLSIMHYNGGRLRRDEIRAMLEIKLVLDRLAAQLAIPTITPAEEEMLCTRLLALNKAEAPPEASAAAFDFYHELAFVSKNSLLPLIYYSFRVPVLDLWVRYGQKYGLAVVCGGANNLFAAIQRRDIEAAVRSIEETVGSSINGSHEIYD